MRRYRSTLRSRQAAETRDRILDAAAESFATNGYAGTTLAAVAERAGVSVETVQANGPKRALLLGSFERRFGGAEGPRPISERPVGRAILDATDRDEFIARLVAFIADANVRTSGLWRAFLAAADGDAEIRVSLDALLARRRQDIAVATRALIERGASIEDPERATDILSFLISPEGYHQLVEAAHWPLEAYLAWLREAIASLAGAQNGSGGRSGSGGGRGSGGRP